MHGDRQIRLPNRHAGDRPLRKQYRGVSTTWGCPRTSVQSNRSLITPPATKHFKTRSKPFEKPWHRFSGNRKTDSFSGSLTRFPQHVNNGCPLQQRGHVNDFAKNERTEQSLPHSGARFCPPSYHPKAYPRRTQHAVGDDRSWRFPAAAEAVSARQRLARGRTSSPSWLAAPLPIASATPRLTLKPLKPLTRRGPKPCRRSPPRSPRKNRSKTSACRPRHDSSKLVS